MFHLANNLRLTPKTELTHDITTTFNFKGFIFDHGDVESLKHYASRNQSVQLQRVPYSWCFRNPAQVLILVYTKFIPLVTGVLLHPNGGDSPDATSPSGIHSACRSPTNPWLGWFGVFCLFKPMKDPINKTRSLWKYTKNMYIYICTHTIIYIYDFFQFISSLYSG